MVNQKFTGGLLALGLLAAWVSSAQVAGAARGGGNRTDISTNVQVVDSTNKLVGEVVGVSPYPPRWLAVLLDSTLVNGNSSLLVVVTGNNIYGSATELYFDAANCTGNAYFKVDEYDNITGTPVFTPTFVVAGASAFTLYKQSLTATPGTISTASRFVTAPTTAQVCMSGPSTISAIPAEGPPVTIDQFTAPFKSLNP